MKGTTLVGTVTLNTTIRMQHRSEGNLSCRYRRKQISGLIAVGVEGPLGVRMGARLGVEVDFRARRDFNQFSCPPPPHCPFLPLISK